MEELKYRFVDSFLVFYFFSKSINDFVRTYSILEKKDLEYMSFNRNNEDVNISTKNNIYTIHTDTFLCEKICKNNKEHRFLRPNEHFIFDNLEKYQKITALQQSKIKKHRKIQSFQNEEIKRLYQIFGQDIVLIHILKGEKRPIKKGWVFFTWPQTQQGGYQKLLERTSIGIHCGDQSNGLCSIDLDDDKSQEIFLDLNPHLNDTVRTRGGRGGNFWVKIKGNCPIVVHFTFGNLKGEFRGSGGQTVIHGPHPSGKNYEIIEGKIPEMYFNELNFPPEITEDISYHYPYYFNNAKFLDVLDYQKGYIANLKQRAKKHSKGCLRINNKTFERINTKFNYLEYYDKFLKGRIEYGIRPAN